jgi:polysaccharide pyruvyl transferase WcaK-like protein
MRIHHFFPRTRNLGDHFVQIGITRMIRELVPEAVFELHDVNSRGLEKVNYGLSRTAIERANKEADLIIVGGSNLYEGALGWPWGVDLDLEALEELRVPLFLMGIGTGSSFDSPLHKPSARAKLEIKALNERAVLSGARDVTTLEWLHELAVTKAKLMGDPATFIFNYPLRQTDVGSVLVTIPPRRIWNSKRQFWKVHTNGRAIFSSLAKLTRTLLEKGEQVSVVCNDQRDLPVAQRLFGKWLPEPVVCPATAEEYFQLLSKSRAVVSGRLHTAVVAFSLGIPFLLIDIDQRTHGFLRTYQLETSAILPTRSGLDRLTERAEVLLREGASKKWQAHIEKRDHLQSVAMNLLGSALKSIS